MNWSAPTGGSPKEGYRIDIFDKNRNLIKQIIVSNDDHNIEITLPEGEYYSVVYANDGKVMEKVAKPTSFTVSNDTFLKRLIILWPYLFGTVIGAVAFVFRKKIVEFVTRKMALPPPGQNG